MQRVSTRSLRLAELIGSGHMLCRSVGLPPSSSETRMIDLVCEMPFAGGVDVAASEARKASYVV